MSVVKKYLRRRSISTVRLSNKGPVILEQSLRDSLGTKLHFFLREKDSGMSAGIEAAAHMADLVRPLLQRGDTSVEEGGDKVICSEPHCQQIA
jgi:hypothetical protein